ncbi:MAG: PQQ-binding-like beta-propeller repeat protein [Planctomycetia bacterium]|nr:PQQ-binding-like beta-propeller repeat protein [Planctomycetia bacterium]
MHRFPTRLTVLQVACFAALVGLGISVPVWADEPAGAKSAAADWPQFLGPDRNGVSRETGLLTEWPDGGPKQVWRVAGGQGMSGLAISDGRLLTLVQKSGRQWAICLDAKTGQKNWERDLAPAYRNKMGDGPRATPAIAGGTAFVFTGEGILAALNMADGKILWQKDAVAEFGGEIAEYGMACSPLVAGENVVVVVGAPEATVAAFNRNTGAVAWKAGKDDPAGYSSPAIMKLNGRDHLVVFHGAGAMGVDPARGNLFWHYPYVTDFNCNIATPVAAGGGVLLSSGENHGSVLLKITSNPAERLMQSTPAWESLGPSSVLRNEWQTSILLDGYLYGIDNVGGAGPVSHLTCVEAATGKRQWQQVRFGKGNPIAADGKLFVPTIDGNLVVVKANPQKYDELGRAAVAGKIRQAPALAGGLLYLRDEREIVCLDMRKP